MPETATDDHTFPFQRKARIPTLKDVEIAAYTPGEENSRVELPCMALYASDLPTTKTPFTDNGDPSIALVGDGDLSPLAQPLRDHHSIEIAFPYSTFNGAIDDVRVSVNGDLRNEDDRDSQGDDILGTHVRVKISGGEFTFPDD